jgi:cytochrome P450
MTTAQDAPAPSLPYDLFADDLLTDPFPVYEELREAGPAVWLPNVGDGVWALSRYEDVHAALHDDETFSSVDGIALTDYVNQALLTGTVLGSDGEAHRRLRKPLSKQLNRSAVRRLNDRVAQRADELVAQYVKGGAFDAVELAQHLVADTVMELMGLPDETRQELITNAAAIFDVLGPANPRYQQAGQAAAAMMGYLAQEVSRETVAEGSWMSALYAAADVGDIAEEDVVPLMSAYVTAGMDTTIHGITNAIQLLATHPGQFALLHSRPEPSLAENAVHEALRHQAPIRSFGRRVARATTVGETGIEQGAQVLLLFGSSGRDPRKWGADADTFRIDRSDASDHLALGAGAHQCAGNHLALLEARSIIAALADRCTGLEVDGEPQRALNNLLHGWARLPIAAAVR